MKQKYIDNYHALKNLPIVQKLILKNKQLKKENKNLRNALSLLGEVKCKTICKFSNDNSDIISIYSDDTEESSGTTNTFGEFEACEPDDLEEAEQEANSMIMQAIAAAQESGDHIPSSIKEKINEPSYIFI